MTKQSVLVVDNNPVILKLMTNFLEKEGYDVCCATNGLDALEKLESFQPGIIFIDLIMPKIGGKKLCRILRSMPEMNDVYLIILSAVAVEQDLNFNQFGADFCIAKGPFKQVQSHITHLLELTKKKRTGYLSNTIVGTENVFQRQITSELLLTKQHFEITLDNITEGFVELTNTGKIIYTNNTFCQMVGQKEEQILATWFPGLINDEQKKMVITLIEALPDHPVQKGEETSIFINSRQVLLTFISYENKGNNKSIIGIIQDITERKSVENELFEYREHLEQMVEQRTAQLSNSLQKIKEETRQRQLVEEDKKNLELMLRNKHKMEALGTLAAGVAHDFKNILAGILGFADFLKEDLKESDTETKENISNIIDAGNRALELSSTILTFSRPEKEDTPLFPVLLQDIINETVKLMSASLPSAIIINKNIDNDCCVVMANATQMHQVLMNICTNGIQAMTDSGGTLEINLAPSNVAKSLLPTSATPPQGKWLQLTISDTGQGIAPQIEERIFDPYFTTKENKQGKGLGLAVTKGIIENHGGVIRVSSKLGEGTTFIVFLPIHDSVS